jgi:hypothetical protein
MTLLQLHHDGLRVLAGRDRRAMIRRALRRLRAALGVMHHAIMAARLRRRELMLHDGDEEMRSTDCGAASYPQRPAILGDKWDF